MGKKILTCLTIALALIAVFGIYTYHDTAIAATPQAAATLDSGHTYHVLPAMQVQTDDLAQLDLKTAATMCTTMEADKVETGGIITQHRTTAADTTSATTATAKATHAAPALTLALTTGANHQEVAQATYPATDVAPGTAVTALTQ